MNQQTKRKKKNCLFQTQSEYFCRSLDLFSLFPRNSVSQLRHIPTLLLERWNNYKKKINFLWKTFSVQPYFGLARCCCCCLCLNTCTFFDIKKILIMKFNVTHMLVHVLYFMFIQNGNLISGGQNCYCGFFGWKRLTFRHNKFAKR